jgi:periplasmic protein TonB
MFAESLLEVSWAERGRRSWTTLTSFGLQAGIVGLLLLIPLLSTVGSPSSRTISTPISLGRRDPGRPPQPHGGGVRNVGVRIIPYVGRIMAPSRIPHDIPKGGGQVAESEPIGDPTIGVGPYIGGGSDVLLPIGGTQPAMPTREPKHIAKVFRTSTILQGMLIRKVEPKYPTLAIQTRIQGPVVLAAVISKAGTIDNLRLISGHPMLVPAALDAVSQWRYRPYILNGDVIEVETQITVNFVLGR